MSYQVFARKYRPKTFDDIVGQQHIVKTLKNAIEQKRLAHAYLFVGPRGTGKTSTARIIAKALNCSGGPRVDFDPNEDVCLEIAEGRSMDVLEIDGASNNGVEQIRELRENVRFAPSRGQFKIYIIDEVHMLTPGAFNALLKTLEEPPEHVKFIFATTEPQKVLPTILSRCQRFDLQRIPAKLIANHLQFIAKNEKITLSSEAAAAIAKGADGGLRDAESMLDQLVAFCGERIDEADVLSVFGFTGRAVVADLCNRVLSCDVAGALSLVGEQAQSGKDLTKLLGDVLGYLRNLLVHSTDPNALAEELTAEEREILTQQAALQPFGKIITLIDNLSEAEGRMKWAPNKRLHFEIALIKAGQMLNSATLDEVIETLTALREGSELPVTSRVIPPQPQPKHPAPTALKSNPTASGDHSPITSSPSTNTKSLAEMAAEAVASAKAKAAQAASEPKPAPASAATPEDLPQPSSTKKSKEKPGSKQSSGKPADSLPTPAAPPAHTSAILPSDDEEEDDDFISSPDASTDGPSSEDAWDEEPEPDDDTSTSPNDFPLDLWFSLVHSLREEPFVHACLLGCQPMGIEDGKLVLGFPPAEKVQASMLEDPKRKKQVEAKLNSIYGAPLNIITRIVPGLVVTPVPADKLPSEKDPLENFYNDPLIEAALEEFRGSLDTSASG